MINLYDGNNVMLRAMTNMPVPGQQRISLRRRFETAQANDIWVWDGPKHNDRRQQLLPEYKGQRQPMAEDHFAQIQLFKDLLKHTPATQICVPGWEADDVISTIAYRGKPVRIHTNDLDYAQLAELPTVQLVGVKTWEYPAKYLPLYKALVGDPSDNIPGIPGFGKKSWDEIVAYSEEVISAIRLGSPHAFHHLPFKPAVLNWLADPSNMKKLQAMLACTYFQTVPDDEIVSNAITGKPNKDAAEELMRRYFL